MIIHQKGWKAERDRIILLNAYTKICLELGRKPLKEGELLKLSNYALDRLARDVYAGLTAKQTRWLAEVQGSRPRSREFAWRWFWRDLTNPQPKRRRNTMVPYLKAAN